MIKYEKTILKSLEKGKLPLKVFVQFDNAFRSIDLTQDFTMFDITKLKGSELRQYYRLRKGKYRAIFYLEIKDIFVIKIDKREEVYR